MKVGPPTRSIMAPLHRRDILAICAFLNPGRGMKAVDHCTSGTDRNLEKLAAAARMQ